MCLVVLGPTQVHREEHFPNDYGELIVARRGGRACENVA